MGVSYHINKDLERPLAYVKELTNFIPKKETLSVKGSSFKIVIALHGSVSMEVSPGLKFPLEARDIIVLPKPCLQVYRPLQPDSPATFQTMIIQFDPKWIFRPPSHWGNTLTAKAARLCRECFSEPTRISGGYIQNFQYLLSQIREESNANLPGSGVAVNALICTLLVEIVRAAVGETRAPASVRGDRKQMVHLADDFMFKNLMRRLTVGEVAWHLKMSHEHLSRVFKQETGFTLKHYLGIMRVNHAKNLLLETNLPITRISEACGFSTLALFYRTFRQHLKMTPAEYRRNNQSETTHHWVTPSARVTMRKKNKAASNRSR